MLGGIKTGNERENIRGEGVVMGNVFGPERARIFNRYNFLCLDDCKIWYIVKFQLLFYFNERFRGFNPTLVRFKL